MDGTKSSLQVAWHVFQITGNTFLDNTFYCRRQQFDLLCQLVFLSHNCSLSESARFLGAYRVVPPFEPPSGCPSIPACPQHSRLKAGCWCCEDVAELVASDEKVPMHTRKRERTRTLPRPEGSSYLGLPLPPSKFYTRAKASVTPRQSRLW